MESISGVRGPVLRRGAEGFDGERAGFQTASRHEPDVLVGATGAEDVRAAVTFAAERGLPVTVEATGHGRAVPALGGVLIQTRRMTGVSVDPAGRTVRIEAGVRWGQVIDAAAVHGLTPLSGSSPEVGAVGYTLGGGLGLLARTYGYAADHVRSIDVVTGDGEARHVTADSDPDLFWALRGGGGGFGVVTALEIDLVPVATIYGGTLFFAAGPDVLAAFQEWTALVPEELTSSVGMMTFPDVPGAPESLRGRFVASVHLAFAGAAAEGERLVAPLWAAGPVLRDTLAEMPFAASASIHNDPDGAPRVHGHQRAGVGPRRRRAGRRPRHRRTGRARLELREDQPLGWGARAAAGRRERGRAP
ncbi:FAD-binding oxidoreductase [Pseudonocardia nigra]|uniref:FAD-binding oxidoreductase n=1 Tax=Pseudonocardia nigra TaxID=1921578 RepID=UPI0027E2F0D5|nr:FAD-binding oxidoreductase [Pseudonocardia nigra]